MRGGRCGLCPRDVEVEHRDSRGRVLAGQQLRRLGAYLQSGLLVARDDEGLTTRATRDALAKLDANPERLLG